MTYTSWLSTSLLTRNKIAQQFGIAKVRSTHVADNKVVDDGYNIHDVDNAMTIGAMQAYLDTDESDIAILFQMTVDKFEGKVPEPMTFVIPEEMIQPVTKAPKKVVKKKK